MLAERKSTLILFPAIHVECLRYSDAQA